MLLYARSNLETELASRGRKRLFVDYGDLLSNWRAFAKRLRNVVGPAIRAPRAKTVADIESFLTADLYRQRATRDDLVKEPQSSATAIEIYDRLTEAAKTGNDAALRRSFNHLERTTTDMMRVLRVLLVPPPAAAITSPVEQAPQTDEALEEAAVDEVEADKDAAIGRTEPTEVIHHALNLMADARADLARRLDEVSARAAGLDELRLSLATQLAAADANAAHAVNNISGLEAARADLARQLGEARAGAAELASVREQLQRKLDEARIEIQKLQLSLQGVEARSELHASQVEMLSTHLDQAREEMTEMLTRRDAQEEKLEEARSRASELANQIARSETTRGNLTRQLGEARARATDLLAAKEALQRELDEARADGQRLEVAAREAESRRQQQSLKIEMLERDLDKARGGDPGLIAERDALQRAVEEARSQAQSVEAKALEAGARVEQQAVQIEELARQLEEARRQAAELLAGRDAQQPELELARAEAASAANQIDGLKAALSELTVQLKESRAGTEASVAGRDAAQRELEAVRVEAQSVAARAQAAEERVAQLQSRFETLSNELEESRAVAAELRRSREALERKVTLLTKELEEAREGATELVAGRNALQRQIEQTRSEAQIFEVRAQRADTQTQQQAWQIELLRKDLDEARTRAAELAAGRNLLQLQIEEAGWEPRPGDGHGHDANGAAMQAKPNGAAQAIGAEAPGQIDEARMLVEFTARAVRDSGLFDADDYRRRAGLALKVDPAVHYVTVGERLGIAPSSRFDPAYYAERYPDVGASGMCLLEHYVLHGQREGRRAQPVAAAFNEDASRFDPEKESILLVSHEASRTGAPVLALTVAQNLCTRYNVITILLRGGDLVESFARISSHLILLEDSDRDPIEYKSAVNSILPKHPVRYAIVSSIESWLMLHVLGRAFIPTVNLIHEFSSYTRPLRAVRKSLGWTTELVFSTNATADSFRAEHPALLKRRIHVLPQGRCTLPSPAPNVDVDAEHEHLRAAMRPPGYENALVVLGAGFIHIRKGIDLFIASAMAAAKLAGKRRQIRFAWIGGGFDPEL